jgi:hypothetical protein
MNETEHGLVTVVEELSEMVLELSDLSACAARAQQAGCKALRFSLDDGYPNTKRTNASDLVKEFNDLVGAMERFSEKHGLEGLFNRSQIEDKKVRIEKWLSHSETQGTLTR